MLFAFPRGSGLWTSRQPTVALFLRRETLPKENMHEKALFAVIRALCHPAPPGAPSPPRDLDLLLPSPPLFLFFPPAMSPAASPPKLLPPSFFFDIIACSRLHGHQGHQVRMGALRLLALGGSCVGTGASGLCNPRMSSMWVYATGCEGRHVGYLKRQPLASYLATTRPYRGPRTGCSPLHRVADRDALGY